MLTMLNLILIKEYKFCTVLCVNNDYLLTLYSPTVHINNLTSRYDNIQPHDTINIRLHIAQTIRLLFELDIRPYYS